jgi:hypothetical protein
MNRITVFPSIKNGKTLPSIPANPHRSRGLYNRSKAHQQQRNDLGFKAECENCLFGVVNANSVKICRLR